MSPAITDDNGYYILSGVPASIDQMSPLLSASKPGYFTDIRFANPGYGPVFQDTEFDFSLVPWVSIVLGDVVRGRLDGIDFDACSHWGYGSSACQRFALTVPATGLLEVKVSALVSDFDVDIVGPDGTFALYDANWIPRRTLVVEVEAGSTYEIRVIGGCCPVREFELTTSMR